MPQQVHYEVFRRQGAGGFGLVEAHDLRDEALNQAKALMKNGATGVKVLKETFNEETGDYLSLNIFEEGKTKVKTKAAQEDIPSSPCFRPDDLYSYHARKTIALLIPDFLARHKVTVIEFGHRSDLLEKFEATGTLMQHAIQRVAVAQAADGEQQLHKIIRSLQELTTQAIRRVYKDTEKGRFPKTAPGEFIGMAEKLAASLDGRYLLNGAITCYLKGAKGWDEKVYRLMALMKEAEGESAGAKLLLACIDSLISEVLTGSAGLKEFVGVKDNQGEAVMALIKLFLGKEPDETDGREGLTALTQQFKADTLPNARGAIATRIVGEIRSFKRLHPSSLEEELKMLRQIANLVVLGIGKYLSHEDLVASFVLRSSRLITSEVLASYLAGAAPAEKLERLLFVEENIIGAENKRALVAFVVPIVSSASFEEYFQSPKLPITVRLQQLESLRIRVTRSGFQENQRIDIADAIDRVAAAVETRGRLFDAIEAKSGTPGEKATAILKLLNAGCLTEPRLATRGREMLIAYLGKPGFLSSYVAQSETPEPNAAMADLMRLLELAGIPPEKSMRSIAA
jgi:hypothetical protein